MSDRPIAFVTGPTSGLGEGFATKLASLGYDLVLVARDEERLAALAEDLGRRFDAQSEILVADLATDAGRDAAVARLEKGVQFLVNSAGIGTKGDFWAVDPALLRAQVDLNVTAVLQLTRAALPSMISAAKGKIVNIASVSGLITAGGSSYAASKAYVIALSEGLAGPLDGTGVIVQALCPGFVRTEFHERAGVDASGVPDSMWLDVDKVVKASFVDLDRGRIISIPGGRYKAATTVNKLKRSAVSVFDTARGR